MTVITPDKNNTLAIHGYGLAIRVHAGHLELEWGIGVDRYFARLHKLAFRGGRLIVMGHDGYLTIDAINWLNDAGAALELYDRDGNLRNISVTNARAEDVRLRRAQVWAAFTETGLDIARTLLGRKMLGQAGNLERYDHPDAHNSVGAIRECVEGLGRNQSHETLRLAEARAADMYWRVLSDTPIRFEKRAKVPDHWRHLGRRQSPLTNSPRSAVTPGHALLNYLYALLEGETRQALQVAGLDPQLGFNHVDANYRDSLASDVMETVRPAVDRWVLELLAKRTFKQHDFGETREGVCRLHPQLAQELTATLPAWRAAVEPMVRLVVNVLHHAGVPAQLAVSPHVERDAATYHVRATAHTCCVCSKRSTDAVGRHGKWYCSDACRTTAEPPRAAAPPLSRRCSHCDTIAKAPLERDGRWYCSDTCADAAATLRQYAIVLQDHSTWTPDTWAALWPAIRRVPQKRIRAITGWTSGMSSMVVNGQQQPAPKHWAKLCEGLAA